MPATARSHNLRRVFAARDKIFDDLILKYSNEVIADDMLDEVSDLVLKVISHCTSAKVIRASMLDLLTLSVSKENLAKFYCFAWRIAGNIDLLKAGRPILPYKYQTASEWVPVEIESVKRTLIVSKEKSEIPVNELTMRVLAGTPASKTITSVWTDGLTRYMKSFLGFSKKRTRPNNWPASKPFLAYENQNQLYGLRMMALLTPESCNEKLRYEKITCSSSMVKHNKELLTKRARFNFECPFKYKHACHACPVGKDRCVVACHARTYVQGSCVFCRKNSFFDKKLSKDMCVACFNIRQTKGKRR
jgi:hypothetical protein